MACGSVFVKIECLQINMLEISLKSNSHDLHPTFCHCLIFGLQGG